MCADRVRHFHKFDFIFNDLRVWKKFDRLTEKVVTLNEKNDLNEKVGQYFQQDILRNLVTDLVRQHKKTKHYAFYNSSNYLGKYDSTLSVLVDPPTLKILSPIPNKSQLRCQWTREVTLSSKYCEQTTFFSDIPKQVIKIRGHIEPKPSVSTYLRYLCTIDRSIYKITSQIFVLWLFCCSHQLSNFTSVD